MFQELQSKFLSLPVSVYDLDNHWINSLLALIIGIQKSKDAELSLKIKMQQNFMRDLFNDSNKEIFTGSLTDQEKDISIYSIGRMAGQLEITDDMIYPVSFLHDLLVPKQLAHKALQPFIKKIISAMLKKYSRDNNEKRKFDDVNMALNYLHILVKKGQGLQEVIEMIAKFVDPKSFFIYKPAFDIFDTLISKDFEYKQDPEFQKAIKAMNEIIVKTFNSSDHDVHYQTFLIFKKLLESNQGFDQARIAIDQAKKLNAIDRREVIAEFESLLTQQEAIKQP